MTQLNTLYLPAAALRQAMDCRMLNPDTGKPSGQDREMVESMMVTYLKRYNDKLGRHVHMLFGCNGNSAVRIQWVLSEQFAKTMDFGSVWGLTFHQYVKTLPKRGYIEIDNAEGSPHTLTLRDGTLTQETIADQIIRDPDQLATLHMAQFYAGVEDVEAKTYVFGKPTLEAGPAFFYQYPSSQKFLWDVEAYWKPYFSTYERRFCGKVEWLGEDGPIRLSYPRWKNLTGIDRLQVSFLYMPAQYRDDHGDTSAPENPVTSAYIFEN